MSQALRDKQGNYIINGIKHKSVTTIIHEEFPRAELDAWKERTPDWPEYSRKARIYGIFMHMQLQGLVSDIPVEVPDYLPFWEWPEDMEEELQGRIEQWEALNLVLGKPNLIEHTIAIKEYDDDGNLTVASAGTWDFWGKVDGITALLDWKSSKRPQKAHRLQAGAYYIGALQAGLEVEKFVIPYIRKNNAQIVELMPEELEEEGEKFLELARRAYIKANAKYA
jgi:CRISPR/Cas system-associated exonuclease Cas4 (RecB family)